MLVLVLVLLGNELNVNVNVNFLLASANAPGAALWSMSLDYPDRYLIPSRIPESPSIMDIDPGGD